MPTTLTARSGTGEVRSGRRINLAIHPLMLGAWALYTISSLDTSSMSTAKSKRQSPLRCWIVLHAALHFHSHRSNQTTGRRRIGTQATASISWFTAHSSPPTFPAVSLGPKAS